MGVGRREGCVAVVRVYVCVVLPPAFLACSLHSQQFLLILFIQHRLSVVLQMKRSLYTESFVSAPRQPSWKEGSLQSGRTAGATGTIPLWSNQRDAGGTSRHKSQAVAARNVPHIRNSMTLRFQSCGRHSVHESTVLLIVSGVELVGKNSPRQRGEVEISRPLKCLRTSLVTPLANLSHLVLGEGHHSDHLHVYHTDIM